MLLPLKPGNFLLPSVHIHPRIKEASNSDGRDGADEVEKLNCETDYLSAGECVVVVPDIRSSTVGIGDLGSSKSVVWLHGEGLDVK